MYFRTEHTGNISDTTTVSFELPRYSGCITLQIYTYGFDGNISITYTDPSGAQCMGDDNQITKLNNLFQSATNNNNFLLSSSSHILSLDFLASKLNIFFTFNKISPTSFIDKIIVLV